MEDRVSVRVQSGVKACLFNKMQLLQVGMAMLSIFEAGVRPMLEIVK